MGRAFARVFTRLGKEITIAAKAGGTDPDGNPRLRTLIQTAKSENMPKENIDRAIKRAVEKDAGDYKEVVYEGYGPHGVAILVETATDNINRTVANVRSYFNKFGGSLGTSGSVAFMFDRKCVFRIKTDKPVDLDELELDLIDYGADEVFKESDEETGEETIVIYGDYTAFGNIQKYIEEHGYQLVSGAFERLPNGELKELSEEDKAAVEKLIEKIEGDDDVQNVYHNMA